MADENTSREDKKLPASEQKIRKARAEGQVARSRDLGHAMLLSSTMGCLLLFSAPLGAMARELMVTGLRFDAATAFSAEAMVARLSSVGTQGFSILFPVAAIGALATILASAVPAGFLLTGKPIRPKFNRISPLQGIKRIFSRNHLIDSIKLSALILLLGGVTYLAVSLKFGVFVHMMRQDVWPALMNGWTVLLMGTAALMLILIVVAMIDVPIQWYRNRSELKMTFQEARQEQKETDGDPHLRARIRSRQREIGNARMMADVPTADIIISNPTHYAVALKYDESGGGAPTVVASGVDHIALKIRELASAAGVPNIEVPPLARALWANVPVGQEIPAALYNAVAQVLAYLYRLKMARRGVGQWPDLPEELAVPPELDPESAGAEQQPGGVNG
jgi:flagellar biosynthetic protein FlhB